MSADHLVNCLCCGIPKHEFSDEEIDRMRSSLSKLWHQNKSQVTDYEALHYLRQEARA